MAFRGNAEKKFKFEDVFVIDDERGLAVIQDIILDSKSLPQEESKKRSYFENEGIFLYDLKFFVHTENLSNMRITSAKINVFAQAPTTQYVSPTNVSFRPANFNKSVIGEKSVKNTNNKTENTVVMDRRADAAAVPIATDTVSFNIRPAPKIELYPNANQKNAIAGVQVESVEVNSKSNGVEANLKQKEVDKNTKKPSVQTIAYHVEDNKKDPAVSTNNRGVSKTTFTNTKNSALLEAINKTAQTNVNAFSPDAKTKSPGESKEVSFSLMTNFLTHPAVATESFLPTGPKNDPSRNKPPASNTRDVLDKVRDPVVQVSTATTTQGPLSNKALTGHEKSVNAMTSAVSPINDLVVSPKGEKKKFFEDLGEIVTAQTLDVTVQKVKTNVLVEEFVTKFVEMFKKIKIDMQKAGTKEKLYFEVLLFEQGESEPALRNMFVVDHQRQVTEYTVPDIKPLLEIGKQTPGKNQLIIAQRDPVASSIIIERREYSPSSPDYFPFVQVRQIDITSREKLLEISVPETNIAPNMCIYRAISVGPLGQRAQNFSTLVTRGMPIPSAAKQFDKKAASNLRSPDGFFTRCVTDGILITLTHFPQGALSFYINKTSIGTQSEINRQTQLVPFSQRGDTLKSLRRGNVTSEITVLDRDVLTNRFYKYQCVFKMPHGEKILGSTVSALKFIRPVRQLPVDVNITNLRLLTDDQGTPEQTFLSQDNDVNAVISFDISTVSTQTGIQEVTQLLIDAGVSDVFVDDLKKDRSRLSSLAFYDIQRVDTKTGKSESFGITRDGKFQDSPSIRAAKKISNPISGRRYTYIVSLCLSNPESLFKTAITQLSEGSSTALKQAEATSKVLSQRFASMYTKSDSLPSENELLDRSADSLLKQIRRGQTGFSKTIDVSIPDRTYEIIDFSVTRSRLGSNVLTWRISGDSRKIDHFVVYAHYDKTTQPIAIVAPDGDNTLSYYDKQMSSLIGNVSYYVESVSLDFSRKKHEKSASIYRTSSMSSDLVKKLADDSVGTSPAVSNASAAFGVAVDVKKAVQVRVDPKNSVFAADRVLPEITPGGYKNVAK